MRVIDGVFVRIRSPKLEFLNTNNQNIIIAVASPLSEDDTAIVVSMAFAPISCLTTIAFDSDDVALYLSHQSVPVAIFNPINMALQTKVSFGQAYSFNGIQINGEGNGSKGYVSIYFNAPSNSTSPVVTGLASYIYDIDMEKPLVPSPINYFTLNRFETQVIPGPSSVVWVFIASEINAGSVLPISVLKSVSDHAQIMSGGTVSFSSMQTPLPQIGRYLPVNLEASEQNTIHFDLTINAFVYGTDADNECPSQQ